MYKDEREEMSQKWGRYMAAKTIDSVEATQTIVRPLVPIQQGDNLEGRSGNDSLKFLGNDKSWIFWGIWFAFFGPVLLRLLWLFFSTYPFIVLGIAFVLGFGWGYLKKPTQKALFEKNGDT